MYDWLRVPAAGVCTWRGRTFGRWTRHADWVCNPVWAVLDSGIGCRGRKVVLRDRRIYGKRSVAVGKLAVILAKRRKMPFLSEAERTEGVRMHMSVPILLGYIAYVTGGVSIGI